MIGLGAVNGIRHHAIKRGIERRQVSQESAALTVGSITGVRLSFEKTFRFPIWRSVRNGVHLIQNVLPIATCIAGSGKNTRQPDDGDVVPGTCGGKTHEALPTAETRSG